MKDVALYQAGQNEVLGCIMGDVVFMNLGTTRLDISAAAAPIEYFFKYRTLHKC